ncbi:survival protein SurE [Myxococcota bacterium]|nr:survival protein SurE [Myxococcota bacterium]
MLHRYLALIFSLSIISLWILLGCSDDSANDSSGSSNDDSRPLRILVTNDDGFNAEGIDAIVESLLLDPANEVTVCAPNGNRSGTSDETNCGTLSVVDETTASGYPVTAIDGCPADAVIYALANLYRPGEAPDLVISGLNSGQNVSELVTGLSGTIGAAKTAARRGVWSLAASQGKFEPDSQYDYAAGAEAVLAWLAENRDTLRRSTSEPTNITSMNIPSCKAGSIRGIRLVPLDTAEFPIGFVDAPDCESTLENPTNDIEALNNGFISQTLIPLD